MHEEIWVLNIRQTDNEQYTFALVPVFRTSASSPQHTMIMILYSNTLLLLPPTYRHACGPVRTTEVE